MFEQMTVIDKCAHYVGISEVHPERHTWIPRALPVPIWNIDDVPQEGLIDCDSIPLRQKEVNLVNVKCMHLWRAIFDYPVFDIPLSGRDTWGGLLRIERLRSLPFHSEHELGRTIGTTRVLGPLGEVERSGAHRRDVAKPYRCRGGEWPGRYGEP